MAKALQVGPIQAGSALGDGLDVIHMERGTMAAPAKRLGGQVSIPQPAPSAVITTLGTGLTHNRGSRLNPLNLGTCANGGDFPRGAHSPSRTAELHDQQKVVCTGSWTPEVSRG